MALLITLWYFTIVIPSDLNTAFNSFDLYYEQPQKVQYFNTKNALYQSRFCFWRKRWNCGRAEFAINPKPNVSLGV